MYKKKLYSSAVKKCVRKNYLWKSLKKCPEEIRLYDYVIQKYNHKETNLYKSVVAKRSINKYLFMKRFTVLS